MSHLLSAIAWTLIHFCWQAGAVAALYGVISLMVRSSTSQVRYAIALSALLGMLVCALGTFAWQISERSEPESMTSANFSTAMTSGSEDASSRTSTLVAGFSESSVEATAAGSIPVVMPWIDACWLLGVFVLSLRSLGGWWLIHRLRKSAAPVVSAAVRATFDSIRRDLGLRRSVELAISDLVPGPLTIGFMRAVVLVPLSAVTSLGPEELKVVLAHELAHVRRADFFWNLVQTFAETLFFFHPAVWWIGSCLRTERELCCDDLALKLCPNPVVYASALFQLEKQRSRQPRLAMALDGHRSGFTLRMRIQRILGEPVRQVGAGPSRAFSMSVALAGILLLILPSAQVVASLRPARPAVAPVAEMLTTLPTPTPSPRPMLEKPAPAQPSTSMRAEIQESAAPQEKPRASTPSDSKGHSTYIDRMKSEGYDVDLDKYIAMKVQDVTPEYAREMSKAGFGKLSADDLIACKIQGVTPEYIALLKQQGLEAGTVHDAIAFRIFGVTPEFVSSMKAAGFSNLSTHQLMALRVQGVTPEYAKSITQEFPGATVEDVVQTKIFNIDAAFIDSAKKHGFNNLSLQKLVKLRISGLLDDEK